MCLMEEYWLSMHKALGFYTQLIKNKKETHITNNPWNQTSKKTEQMWLCYKALEGARQC